MTDVERTGEHLRMLATAHGIYAGLAAGFFPVALFSAFFGFEVDAAMLYRTPASAEEAEALRSFLQVHHILIIALPVLCGLQIITNLLSWRFLKARRHLSFCRDTALLNLFGFPIGTILAVVTMTVLYRKHIRAIFSSTDAPANPPNTGDE